MKFILNLFRKSRRSGGRKHQDQVDDEGCLSLSVIRRYIEDGEYALALSAVLRNKVDAISPEDLRQIITDAVKGYRQISVIEYRLTVGAATMPGYSVEAALRIYNDWEATEGKKRIRVPCFKCEQTRPTAVVCESCGALFCFPCAFELFGNRDLKSCVCAICTETVGQ